VKVYDGRTETDAKWWQKLTLPLARWANNAFLESPSSGTLKSV
jgi:hypothetical protein